MTVRWKNGSGTDEYFTTTTVNWGREPEREHRVACLLVKAKQRVNYHIPWFLVLECTLIFLTIGRPLFLGFLVAVTSVPYFFESGVIREG